MLNSNTMGLPTQQKTPPEDIDLAELEIEELDEPPDDDDDETVEAQEQEIP